MKHGKSACLARCMVLFGALAGMIIGCVPNSARSVRNDGGMISTYGATEPLPRPDRIFVHDFAVSSDDVSPDNALVYELHHNELKGPSEAAEQVQVGRAVANVVSEKLVNAIRSLGLPAERALGVEPLAKGNFSLEGQFISIDGGNRPRRITIGFGVGNTKVRTLVQGYFGTAYGPHLVEEFETHTERSSKRGMEITIGPTVAMAADVASRFSELTNAAEDDARRTAVALARQLLEFFAVQGWIVQDMAE
jgi:hypothetical protein